MDFDTIYENMDSRSNEDSTRPQRLNLREDEGRGQKQRGRVCLMWMTVILGLICVLLLVFIIWMNIIITTEREKHETTVQEFNHLRTERDQLQKSFDHLTEKSQELEISVMSWNGFFLSTEAKSWSGIRQFCRDRGGDLVTIKTEEKQRLISSLIKEKMWIGLTDMQIEGTMKWVDDSPLKKGFWSEDEPNDFLNYEDCVELDPAKDAANNWNDCACIIKQKGICESSLNKNETTISL